MEVYIWGAGKLARKLINRGIHADIKGFIETYKTKDIFMEKKVYSPDEIDQNYDAIIVANAFPNEVWSYARNVKEIDRDRMIFMNCCLYVDPRNNLPLKREILGEANYGVYVAAYDIFEDSFFAADKVKYRLLNKRPTFEQDDRNDYPIIKDKYDDAGTVNNYFWQDLWAARLIYQNMPKEHYDIGSRLDGFIAHVLAMDIPVKMIDIRPFPEEIDGLETIVDDATELREFADDSIESLSALCSLEHMGLGRYGDPIDPEACFKCMEQIQNKLKIGGKLYIAVPIGKEKVHFNAHRCFFAQTIIDCFHKLKLLEFSCTAGGKLERNVDIHKYDEAIDKGNYRFGLFYFIREA